MIKKEQRIKKKKLSGLMLAAAFCMLLPAGCGKEDVKQAQKLSANTSVDETSESAAERAADLSMVYTDISQISVPDYVRVTGLGEASHGVKEYHQMKGEVFKTLVENNGCRSFVIEGDFGGALKVEAYIQGGPGTAEEVVREIGFAIYNTRELADIVEWMRTYNSENDQDPLHFYGMDMQRVDNNKEYLFSVLDSAAPELSETYRTALEGVTDELADGLEPEILEKAKTDVEELLKEMDAARGAFVSAVGQLAFDRARECAHTISEYMELLQCGDMDYNTVRDQYMFEKVQWLMEQEKGMLFINGHNGHIGKTAVSNYVCLGELLSDSLKEGYFAIGTDAEETEFHSQENDGSFSVKEVSNRNLLNGQLERMDSDFYYVDFARASADQGWQEIFGESQKIITLNVMLTEFQQRSPLYYTASIVPKDTFDGMIVFRKVSPTTFVS